MDGVNGDCEDKELEVILLCRLTVPPKSEMVTLCKIKWPGDTQHGLVEGNLQCKLSKGLMVE